MIAHLKKRPSGASAVGASEAALDALESKLMVELPPSLRAFLGFDFTFATLGKRFRGRHRFGTDPRAPRPKITSVQKLSEAMTDLGWTDARLKGKVVRLPNLPGQPWNALYLGEARRDGELVILGLENEDTNVRVFPRYTAFDLYLVDQAGLAKLSEGQRLDDLESHLALNPELVTGEEEEEPEGEF
ncbi:MAG: SMI1/KNR4 family protein [Polyangiaceae bacterium]|nr:SMI1/KNR4 family protein [Polyangiaceae bacterium]